jgi:adenine deaminase
MKITGNIVDLVNSRIFYGTLIIEDKTIKSVEMIDTEKSGCEYIIPGFIDSHIHIESSMLTPVEFSRVALHHGTVATVSDAHEIANVSGINGVKFMLDNARMTPLKFRFSAPSCVPFDAGSPFAISPADVEDLMKLSVINHLGEVMNVAGVLNDDPDLLKKIEITRKYNKAVDGHAPGLSGEALKKYATAGITTDHECVELNEALEKIACGIKIQIREGSAAKDFDALFTLLNTHPDFCMFASDDRHPDDLLKGHINLLVKKAVARGIAPLNALKAASLNPVRHYKLDCGLLQPGDSADFIEVDNLRDFTILKTYIDGELVNCPDGCRIQPLPASFDYLFNTSPKTGADFLIEANGKTANVIEAFNGSLVTKRGGYDIKIKDGFALCDTAADIVKIVLISRYDQSARPVVGFIKNTGFKNGAIASSVNHDAHNIIAAGSDDESIARAVNMVINAKGGISAVAACGECDILPLPIGGIISDMPCEVVSAKYARLEKIIFDNIKTSLTAPFMTLSFMSLFVIPSIKMSTAGLFDADNFRVIGLFER